MASAMKVAVVPVGREMTAAVVVELAVAMVVAVVVEVEVEVAVAGGVPFGPPNEIKIHSLCVGWRNFWTGVSCFTWRNQLLLVTQPT